MWQRVGQAWPNIIHCQTSTCPSVSTATGKDGIPSVGDILTLGVDWDPGRRTAGPYLVEPDRLAAKTPIPAASNGPPHLHRELEPRRSHPPLRPGGGAHRAPDRDGGPVLGDRVRHRPDVPVASIHQVTRNRHRLGTAGWEALTEAEAGKGRIEPCACICRSKRNPRNESGGSFCVTDALPCGGPKRTVLRTFR